MHSVGIGALHCSSWRDASNTLVDHLGLVLFVPWQDSVVATERPSEEAGSTQAVVVHPGEHMDVRISLSGVVINK
eukprot:5136155-Amphidinium_carterae.1